MTNKQPTLEELQTTISRIDADTTDLGLDTVLKIHSSMQFADSITDFTKNIVNAETTGEPVERDLLIQLLADIDNKSTALMLSFGVSRKDIAAHNAGKLGKDTAKKPRKARAKSGADNLQNIKDAAKKAIDKRDGEQDQPEATDEEKKATA